MEKLIKTYDFSFLFDIRTTCKIKAFDYHCIKPWVIYITNNNVFALWDYERKICLKTFNTSILDPNSNENLMISLTSRNSELKGIKFLDKETIYWLFPTCQPYSEKDFELIKSFNKNWIIFYSEQKVIFYDYVTDQTEILSNMMLENKTIKTINIIDQHYLIIGCGDGSLKLFDLISWSFTKTFKNYHTKGIGFVHCYREGAGQKARFIVSSGEGLLACWNADVETPIFKFLMIKKGKPLINSNDGQEIISMSYDEYNYRLVTLTEDYIAVWSSLSGMEMKRYKNKNLKEIHYFGHSNFSQDGCIGHCRGSEIFLFELEQENRVMFNLSPVEKGKTNSINLRLLLDLKVYPDIDRSISIISLKVHFLKQHLLIIGTTNGFYIISLNRISEPPILFNNSFISYLSVQNAREAVFEDGTPKNLSQAQISKFVSYEASLSEEDDNRTPNFMFLTCFEKKIQCNLFELISFYDKTELNQCSIKSNIHCFDTVFPWDECTIKSSSSGKLISVYNRLFGYFEIFLVVNKHLNQSDGQNSLNLMSFSNHETLHLLSSLKKVYSGCAIDLEWHNCKDEFALLVPIGKDGNFIKLEEKEEEIIKKTSIFNTKIIKNKNIITNQDVYKVVLCIFEFSKEKEKFNLIKKEDSFESPIKLFPGPFYGIVEQFTDKDLVNTQEFADDSILKELKTLKLNKLILFGYNSEKEDFLKINRFIIEPNLLFWNPTATLCIAAYNTQIHIFKINENKEFKLFKQFRHSIISGFFWENLFFFSTEDEIYLLISTLLNDIILIKLAAYDCLLPFDTVSIDIDNEINEIFDTIYPKIQKRPPGHLKFLLIYDFKLITINQSQELGAILLDHPFIKFCMLLQFGEIDKCMEITRCFEDKLHYIFADLLLETGYKKEAFLLKGLNIVDKVILDIKEGKNNVTEEFLIDNILNQSYDQNWAFKQIAIELSQKGRDKELEQMTRILNNKKKAHLLEESLLLIKNKNLYGEILSQENKISIVPKLLCEGKIENEQLNFWKDTIIQLINDKF